MKGSTRFVGPACAAIVVTAAWGGHELPIYPSFYPHEIEIRSLAPDRAAASLRSGEMQAYVGPGLSFAGAPPAELRTIESLGAFIVVRVNPASARANDEAATCAAATTVVKALTGLSGVIAHAYPVTPLHGDYLHQVDLAAAAQARVADSDASVTGLKVKAGGSVALAHPDWSARDTDWDVEVTEVEAAALTNAAMLAMNGWLVPPWVRTGWFHAERLLADAVVDPERKLRVETDLARLKSGDLTSLVERINLERDLVRTLTTGCRTMVAGYRVKHEYVNVEYSAGIENIGYDAIDGLNSPIFIRTVKLKDFPWNGWLAVGIGSSPAAAWNPIGGMNDPFGRLLAVAVGDPALIPSPYEAGWMLNRIADVQSNAGR